jgi:hypothetical protein
MQLKSLIRGDCFYLQKLAINCGTIFKIKMEFALLSKVAVLYLLSTD